METKAGSKSVGQLKHLSLFSALCVAAFASPSQAVTLTSQGHAAGEQCSANGVNNDGKSVGTCSPGDEGDPPRAWVAVTPGTQIPLQPLATGQGCRGGSIGNATQATSGWIVGTCVNANNVPFGVFWSASAPAAAPIRMNPLPGLLGLLADVSTSPIAMNRRGGTAGVSLSGMNDATAVLWAAGSGAPVSVSNRGDNCSPADVNDTLLNGYPSVALNCPDGTGQVSARIAQYNNLLGYQMTNLPQPAGASYCVVTAINNGVQAMGSCVYPNSAATPPDTAFWSCPTCAPSMLSSLVDNPRNVGEFLNNLGQVVFKYQGDDGKWDIGRWTPATNTIELISPITGGTRVSAAGLADNGMVLLGSENADENIQPATWTSATGTVAIPFFDGGTRFVPGAISQNGAYAAGMAEDSSQQNEAILATLP